VRPLPRPPAADGSRGFQRRRARAFGGAAAIIDAAAAGVAPLSVHGVDGTAAAACAADLGGGGGGGGGAGDAAAGDVAAGAGATAARRGDPPRKPTAARDTAWAQRDEDFADPDFESRYPGWAAPSAAAGQAPPSVPGRVNGGAIGRPHLHSFEAATAAVAAGTAAAASAAAHAQQQHHSAVSAGPIRRCCRQRHRESRPRHRAIHVTTRRHRILSSGRRWGGGEAPLPGRRCEKQGGTLNWDYLAARAPASFLKLAVALPAGARAITDAV